MRGKVVIMGGAHLSKPWLPGHGTVTDDVVPPRGHKLWVKERDRAVLLVDDGVEHVIRFAVEHDRKSGVRLDVDVLAQT